MASNVRTSSDNRPGESWSAVRLRALERICVDLGQKQAARSRSKEYNDTSAGTSPSGRPRRIAMFFFQEGFTYRNFLLDVLTIFFFIVWFWLLITVASDLFRRHDISGWVKALWVIGWIVFPFIFMLAYLIFQGRDMA